MNFTNYTGMNFTIIDLSVYISAAPIYASILTVWISIVNIMLIGVIMTSLLRRELRYKLIVCCCTSDLFFNLLYNPLIADYAVRGGWVHGCVVQIVTQVIVNFGDLFLELWYVVIIVAEFMFREAWSKRHVVISRRCRTFLTILVLSIPWLFAVVLLPPIIFTGINESVKAMWNNEQCHLLLWLDREIVLCIICYYLPTFITASFLVYATVHFFFQKRDISIQNRIILEPNNTSENPLQFLAPWLVVTVLALPEQITVLMYVTGSVDISSQASFDAFVTCAFFDSFRLGVLPIAWFFLPEVRDAAKSRQQLFRNRLRSNLSEITSSGATNVSYSDLKEDVVI